MFLVLHSSLVIFIIGNSGSPIQFMCEAGKTLYKLYSVQKTQKLGVYDAYINR